MFSAAWRVYTANIVRLALFSLVFFLPMNALLDHLTPDSGSIARQLGTLIRYSALLEAILGIVPCLAAILCTEAAVRGTPITTATLWRRALRLWPAGMIVELLALLVIGLMTLLLVIPGIVWMGYYAFVTQRFALAGHRGATALGASHALVKGRWWYVAGRALALSGFIVAAGVVLGVASAVLEVFVAEVPPLVSWLSDTLLDGINLIVTCGMTAVYLHLEHNSQPPTSEAIEPASP